MQRPAAGKRRTASASVSECTQPACDYSYWVCLWFVYIFVYNRKKPHIYYQQQRRVGCVYSVHQNNNKNITGRELHIHTQQRHDEVAESLQHSKPPQYIYEIHTDDEFDDILVMMMMRGPHLNTQRLEIDKHRAIACVSYCLKSVVVSQTNIY